MIGMPSIKLQIISIKDYLYLYIFLCLQILLIEGYRAHKEEKPLYLYAAACYKILIPFMFGAAVTQLTTDIAKYTVGRLRPHFLTVCMPNATVCASNTGRM